MDAVERFLRQAERYLDLVRGAANTDAYTFLRECALVLPAIYERGQELGYPESPVQYKDDYEESMALEADAWPYLSGQAEQLQEEFRSVMAQLERLLGDHDPYWEIFDPVSNEEPLECRMSCDLAEIYEDLLKPMEDFQSGDQDRRSAAVWRWKSGIEIHTGDHILSVLRPIHSLVYNHMNPDSQDGESESES